MRKYDDGWHTIAGYRVWVEDGRVIRGVKEDRNGGLVTTAPYQDSRYGGADNVSGVKCETFRRGVYAGRYFMT